MEGKGNDGKGDTPERDLWRTKQELFDSLDKQYNFTFDCCANLKNRKTPQYSSEFHKLDDLSQYICWMNPPFKQVGKWVKKAYNESQKGATVVCLVASRTNTNWWHDYCMKGEVRFIKGRPKFKGNKYGLPQPLAIVIFRCNTTKTKV